MAHIVVVDDDLLVRRSLEIILTGAGFQVSTAPHGRAGLALAQVHRPDLVITDIVMPEIDGIETILRLRQHIPDIPILAISGASLMGNGDPEMLLQMVLRLGVDEVLAKPFSSAALLCTVRKCLSPA